MLIGAVKTMVLGCVAAGTFLLGVAAAQQGPVKASQTVDELYDSAKVGNAAALRQLRTFAGGGNAVAQFNLGTMYYMGAGLSKDAAQAVIWYHKAVEQGVASAQFNLGLMYANGEGVPKNGMRYRFFARA